MRHLGKVEAGKQGRHGSAGCTLTSGEESRFWRVEWGMPCDCLECVCMKEGTYGVGALVKVYVC